MDDPLIIFIDVPEPKYIPLATQDEPATNAGMAFVSDVLCRNYADGETLTN